MNTAQKKQFADRLVQLQAEQRELTSRKTELIRDILKCCPGRTVNFPDSCAWCYVEGADCFMETQVYGVRLDNDNVIEICLELTYDSDKDKDVVDWSSEDCVRSEDDNYTTFNWDSLLSALEDTVGNPEQLRTPVSPVSLWVYWCSNYSDPKVWIPKVWPGAVETDHFLKKFLALRKIYSGDETMNRFYRELSTNNQEKLRDWIIKNYKY